MSERFAAAAERVLREDSMHAAHALEAAALDEYLDDDRLDDLLWNLSLYSPVGGEPHLIKIDALRASVTATLKVLGETSS